MMFSISNRAASSSSSSSKGFSLLELGVAMICFAVIGLTIAKLMFLGTEAQRSYRTHINLETATTQLMDSLRIDLLTAKDIAIDNDAKSISFTTYNSLSNAEEAVTWSFDGQALRNSVDMLSNASSNVVMTADCGGASIDCFELQDQGAGTNNVLLTLNELVVTYPADNRSRMDRNFGAASFRVNETVFDVISGMQFQ